MKARIQDASKAAMDRRAEMLKARSERKKEALQEQEGAQGHTQSGGDDGNDTGNSAGATVPNVGMGQYQPQTEEQQKDAEMVKMLTEKASEGDADAQYALGSAYERGVGTDQNYSQAFKWYMQLAPRSPSPATRSRIAKE